MQRTFVSVFRGEYRYTRSGINISRESLLGINIEFGYTDSDRFLCIPDHQIIQ